jgi:hypothetical protein
MKMKNATYRKNLQLLNFFLHHLSRIAIEDGATTIRTTTLGKATFTLTINKSTIHQVSLYSYHLRCAVNPECRSAYCRRPECHGATEDDAGILNTCYGFLNIILKTANLITKEVLILLQLKISFLKVDRKMIVRSFVNTHVLRSCLAQFAFFVFILKIFPMVQSILAENNLTDRHLTDRHLTDRRLSDRRLVQCFVNSAVTL